MSDTAAPRLHALLIGVDHYLPNDLPGGVCYPSLEGSVRDVEAMESYLLHGLGVPASRLEKLTASAPWLAEPPEPREVWPTYENLTTALKRLESRAAAGEQVLIHYSGHGGRATTLVPEVKGARGVDEGLVPLDIGDSEARYLRDLELAAWLHRMHARGVFVTLILDCCHSGGAVRKQKQEKARGIDAVDASPRPPESLLASREELLEAAGAPAAKPPAAWNGGRPWPLRHTKLASGRHLHPQGYTLLAACSPQQRAVEAAIDGGEPRGVLTYYLLQALGRMEAGATYRDLHEAVRAHIQVGTFSQTPMLEGEEGRTLFGRRELPVRRAINVLGPDPGPEGATGARISLNTGLAQGVLPGARLMVFPLASRPGDSAAALARVEVVEARATVSSAAIIERLRPDPPIRCGDRAELQVPGPRRRRGVRLLGARNGAAAGSMGALECLRDALEASGWLRPAGWGEAAAFEVRVGGASTWELRDGSGEPIPYTGPPLVAGEPGAERLLLGRLEHLARYCDLRQLGEGDARSLLAGKLHLRMERLPEGYQDGRLNPIAPFEPPEGPYRVRVGEWLQLRICNDSPDELYLAVLDLQPDWGVTQVFPAPAGGDFQPLEAGKSTVAPFCGCLPEPLAAGTDLLKVFATTGPVSWRWLEMPELAEAQGAPDPAGSGEEPEGAAAPTAAGGGGEVTGASHEWVAAAVELEVVRERPSGGSMPRLDARP